MGDRIGSFLGTMIMGGIVVYCWRYAGTVIIVVMLI